MYCTHKNARYQYIVMQIVTCSDKLVKSSAKWTTFTEWLLAIGEKSSTNMKLDKLEHKNAFIQEILGYHRQLESLGTSVNISLNI